MIDLKKLDEKLDAALAKETKESLNTWLEGQIMEELFENLRQAEIKQYSSDTDMYTASTGLIEIDEAIKIIIEYFGDKTTQNKKL